jgi:hypothetical protein
MFAAARLYSPANLRDDGPQTGKKALAAPHK